MSSRQVRWLNDYIFKKIQELLRASIFFELIFTFSNLLQPNKTTLTSDMNHYAFKTFAARMTFSGLPRVTAALNNQVFISVNSTDGCMLEVRICSVLLILQ